MTGRLAGSRANHPGGRTGRSRRRARSHRGCGGHSRRGDRERNSRGFPDMLTKAGQDALPVGRANCARLPPEALPPTRRTVAGSGARMYRGSGRQVAGTQPSHALGAVGPPHCL